MSLEDSKSGSDATSDALQHLKMEASQSPIRSLICDATLAPDTSGDAQTPQFLNGNSVTTPPSRSRTPVTTKSSCQPRIKDETKDEAEEVVEAEVSVKLENGKPKLSRKASHKVVVQAAELFSHLPDATEEAKSHFQVIPHCLYGTKNMGLSDHDALGCDCSPEFSNGQNHACGEDSDCINRWTKMECSDDECGCGDACANQRFQRQQYAKVSVIKTEKKGFGLRADADLRENDFIFEYIGEVIGEPSFRKRTRDYDDEGIKHFYFMSLTKSEFVDATKKGNLGRFCNHSCNPNCFVDKWVVGNKLRMGIFAQRSIKAGEELVFNYNVDRYGADPQPCYCNEENCTGFIGGKTQTERATKLSIATIEALGIEDADGWDTAVAKKPRKKKTGEDDEEYVNNVQPKGLDEDGVTKVMATLMQCTEKWIAVKLLGRIQRCDDDRVRNRVVRMHGYQILRTTLTTFSDDHNVVLQILDILYKLPRLTKNKITDAKIESALSLFKDSEHEDIKFESNRLLEEWAKLETAYRISKKKHDPTKVAQLSYDDRRDTAKEEPVQDTKPATPTFVAPTGPKNAIPQRAKPFFPAPRPFRSSFNGPLPAGWFTAVDQNGNTYYYNKSGNTTWQRPNIASVEQVPVVRVPPKAIQDQKALQDIIDNLTRVDATSRKSSPSVTPSIEIPKEKRKEEKWKALPMEKQMKIYENTLFPSIKFVMDKFRHKLPKDELKKYAKDLGKKLVASDYKNKRVSDPTKITEKGEKKVKQYVKDYLDKAVAKKHAHDKARKARKAAEAASKIATKQAPAIWNGQDESTQITTIAQTTADMEADANESRIMEESLDVDDVEMSDIELDDIPSSPHQPEEDETVLSTPSEESLKRKREEFDIDEHTNLPYKRTKDEDDMLSPAPPPPPPPPPIHEMSIGESAETTDLGLEINSQMAEVDRSMAEQEAALIKENEDALKDEEENIKNQMDSAQGLDHNILSASINDEALPEPHDNIALQVDKETIARTGNGE